MEHQRLTEEERRKQQQEKRKQDDAERSERVKREKEERDKRMEELKKQMAAKSSSSSSSAPKVYSGADAIIYWAQTRCEDYGIEVKNFTTSWKDGLAFCALVHSYFPKSIDYQACKNKTPNERCSLAFEAAGQQGVPPLLDPEDVTEVQTPDKRSMMTYLSCLYKGFKR